jgi:hypothetical protein
LWKIKNKSATASHNLCAIWLAYYVSCPVNASCTGRTAYDMREIPRPSGIYPGANPLSNPNTPNYRYKEDKQEFEKQKKQKDKKQYKEQTSPDKFSSDDSSHEYKDKTSLSKTSSKKDKSKAAKDKSKAPPPKRRRDKSDDDEEEGKDKRDKKSGNKGSKKPRSNMVRARRQKAESEKKRMMYLDSGASPTTLLDTKHIEQYAEENNDRNITMTTASGHRLEVTHTGRIPGIGEFMVVPQIACDLLSANQLLKSRRSISMHPGPTPHAVITTNTDSEIVIPLNPDDQFEMPHAMITDLIEEPLDIASDN